MMKIVILFYVVQTGLRAILWSCTRLYFDARSLRRASRSNTVHLVYLIIVTIAIAEETVSLIDDPARSN